MRAEGKKTTGHVAGSLKHGEAERIVKNYQYDIEHRGLETEQPYYNHVEEEVNRRDCTRLDVYDTTNNQVYDYKFVINPGKGLSSAQINKIIRHGPHGLTKSDIHEINPQ